MLSFVPPFKVWWEVPGEWDTINSKIIGNLTDAIYFAKSKCEEEDIETMYVEDATGKIVWEHC